MAAHALAHQAVLRPVLDRQALHELRAVGQRQLDAGRRRRVAHHALGILAAPHFLDLVEIALAHHHDAPVAGGEIFLAPVGDTPLPHPGQNVLVDHMAGDPLPVGIGERALPGGYGLLHIGLAPLGHAGEEEGDAEGVLVIDRHAPFEMLTEKEADGPEGHAAHGPEMAALGLALAHALVEKAMLELVEGHLEMLGREFLAAPQTRAPIVVHPFEMHGIAGVFLALQPVAGHV